jgi:hypothetical protein
MTADLPHLSSPAAEPVELRDVEIFQAAFEHAGSRGDAFLPSGLVPTIPTLVTFLAVRAPDSPTGPFTFAQVRISCRSGARARALAVATAVDAAPATAAWLAERWGIAGQGAVRYVRRYDRVDVTAPWFDVTLEHPKPIGVHDVQYVTGLHPVATADGERLAQVEVEMELGRVERGRPVLHRFDAPGTAAGLNPTFPVAATSGVGTLVLPRLRFILRPDVPPHLGTEHVHPAAVTSS